MVKNIEACRELSKIARTSLGPNGMNKMVINHLEKLFVTSDAAVIMRELEVAHPAARVAVMAAEAQEREVGDGTNFVVSFAGELLGLAEELIRDGLHERNQRRVPESVGEVLGMVERGVSDRRKRDNEFER